MKMINRMLSILSNQKATPKKVLSTPKRKATSSTPKAKKRFFERSDITTSFSTPSEMCSKFGFEAVVLLCFATQHVPIMFPNRLTYIRNIVNSGKRTFTSEEILDSVQSVESWKDTPWPLSGYSYHRTLWEISQHTSTSHMLFLAPPVDSCLHCGGKVYASDSSSHATVFTLGFGPLPALKCTLRCRECSSRYNLCDYRIPNIGTKYYPSNCVTPYVEVSTCTYFEKNVHEFMCESSNHGIVSASAFTEIYNSVYSTDHNFTRNFYESKLSASNSFKDPPAEDHTPVYLPNYEKEHSSSTADINCIEQELRSTGYQVTMSRKNAINSFFNGELEKEVRERQMVEEVTFQKKDDRKVLMNKIDELRRAELYPHTETECSSICKERGCENLRIIDGNWKLCVQHCLYSIPMEIDGQPLLNFPSVCTQEPQAGSVFCDDHFQLLKKKEIPVSKPDFLRCAGIDGPPKNPEERKEYDSKLAAFCRKLDGKDNISKSAAYYQEVLQKRKWENVMTLDKYSAGYRRNAKLEDYFTMIELLTEVAQTVSCGGNILINIGITKEGTVVPIYQDILTKLGKWLTVNGEGIYSSKPWTTQNDTISNYVWYTSKVINNQPFVYAIMLEWPKNNTLILGAPKTSSTTVVSMLGYTGGNFSWKPNPAGGIQIMLPSMNVNEIPCNDVWVIKMQGVD